MSDKVRDNRMCSIGGCESKSFCRSWCTVHYSRWREHGDPNFRIRGEVRDGKRICPGCHVDKPLFEWGRFRCNLCNNKRSAQYLKDNPERRERNNELANARRAKNGDKFRQKEAELRNRNRDRINENGRRYRAKPEAKARAKEYRESRPLELLREYQKRYIEKNPGKYAMSARKQAMSARKWQAESLESATRRGFIWAGWELELISDRSRTSRDLAEELNRTVDAVSHQRGLLRRDPKTITRAGLSDSGIF